MSDTFCFQRVIWKLVTPEAGYASIFLLYFLMCISHIMNLNVLLVTFFHKDSLLYTAIIALLATVKL